MTRITSPPSTKSRCPRRAADCRSAVADRACTVWAALGEAFGIVVVISAIGILHIPKEMVISGHAFGFAFRKLLLCCGAWISGLIERFVAEAGAAVLFDEGQGFVDSRDI